MKLNIFKKGLSVLLTLCVVITLFAGTTILPTSAATGDNMFYIKNETTSNSRDKIASFCDASVFKYETGDTYKFTCSLRYINNTTDNDTVFLDNMFRFRYYDSSNSLQAATKLSEIYDKETYTYTATYTIPSAYSSNNAFFEWGDYNNKYGTDPSNISLFEIWLADFNIEKIDSATNETLQEYDIFLPIISDNGYSGGTTNPDGKYRTSLGFDANNAVALIKSKGDTFADKTDQMIYIKNETSDSSRDKVALFNNANTFKYESGATYKFTCSLRFINNTTDNDAAFLNNMFRFRYYDSSNSLQVATKLSEIYDKETYTYTATYTIPSAYSSNNAFFEWGDYNNAYDTDPSGSAFEIWFADFNIAKIDSNSDEIAQYDAFYGFATEFSYTGGSTYANNKYRSSLGFNLSSSVTFVKAKDDTFAEPDSQLFHIKSAASYYDRINLRNSKNGNAKYELGKTYKFTCKLRVYSTTYALSETNPQVAKDFVKICYENGGNPVEVTYNSYSYDPKTYTYTTTYTIPSSSVDNSVGNAFFYFGDHNSNDAAGVFEIWMSDFNVTQIDEATGEEITTPDFFPNDIASPSLYVDNSNTYYNSKYRIVENAVGNVTIEDKGEVFDRDTNMFYINGSTTTKYVQFRNASNYLYEQGVQYTFSCKVKYDSATLSHKDLIHLRYVNSGGNYATIDSSNSNCTFTDSYDESTYTYTATFTINEAVRNSNNARLDLGEDGVANISIKGYELWVAELSLKANDKDTGFFPNIDTLSTYPDSITSNNKYRVATSMTSAVKVMEKGDTFVQTVTSEPITTGTPYMAVFQQGHNNNYLSYKDDYLKLYSGKTYEFTINEETLSGSPVVKIYHINGSQTIPHLDNGFVSSSSDDKNGNVRKITFTMKQNLTGIIIRIGNNTNSTDISAIFSDVKLVEQGTDKNLISPLTSDSVSNVAGNNKWQKVNYKLRDNNSNFYTLPIPEDTTAKMLYFENVKVQILDGRALYNIAAMAPATGNYILEFDYRAYGGAVPAVDIKYIDSSGTRQRISQYYNQDTTDVSFDPENNHARIKLNLSNLSLDEAYNFQVGFGAYIEKTDGSTDPLRYGRGSIYFGNVSLKAEGSDTNLFINGDLSHANVGDVTTNNVAGWNIYDLSGVTAVVPYTAFKILNQPENFFTESGSDAKMALKLNGGNYDYVRQDLVLKSATKYRLSYKYLFVNAPCTQSIQEINSANEYTNINATNSTFDKETRIKTVEFTTGADLRETYQNAILMFLIQNNGKDVEFHFADVKLYEVDANGNNVGFNLINNGGFLFGEPTTLTDVLKSETSDSRNVDALELLGWQIQGTYEQNNNIGFVNITNQTFAPVAPTFMERIINIRNIILKIEQPTGSIYEDINGITGIDIRDLVATKEEEENYDAPDGAAPEAEAWKAQYLNGNNATTSQTLANFSGTTYYVDAQNGNDNNAGTSTSKPWKTLNKVNNASLKSGDKVLFKCGQTWYNAHEGDPALNTKSGVLYGSYGSGAKPVISGSYMNFADASWTQTSSGVWRTKVNKSSGSYSSWSSSTQTIGIVVYNNGEYIGTMQKTKSDLSTSVAQYGDFCANEVNNNVISSGDGYIYVKSDVDPSTKWSNIQIGQYRTGVELANNVTVDNLSVICTGYHGLATGEGISGVTIQNCSVEYIGGSYNDENRLGNGVQFGQTGSNLTVKNTYVNQCYDAGLTFQTWSGTGDWTNLLFDNNLVENCHYSFEWFLENQTDRVDGVTISNNIFRNAGYGWSYDERIGYGTNLGIIGVSHFRVGGATELRYTNMTNFTFTNNKLDTSKRGLVYWWWNDSDTEDNYDITGFTASGNSFYQLKNDENVISTYRDESPNYGVASYAIRETLKKFENTDAPTGKAETVLTDNTIIYKALTQ